MTVGVEGCTPSSLQPVPAPSPLMHSSKEKKNTFATTKVQRGTTSSQTNVRDDIIFITRIFLLAKLVQYSLIFFTPETPFDTSTDLLLDAFRVPLDDKLKFWNRHVWNKLLSWDAVFFIKGMVRETVPCSDNESPSCCTTAATAVYLPEFEHEFAFSLLWISTVRWMAAGSLPLCQFTLVVTEVLHHSENCSLDNERTALLVFNYTVLPYLIIIINDTVA